MVVENNYYDTNENNVIWKYVRGYEGLYMVSNTGVIKSVDRYVNHGRYEGKSKLIKGRILKQRKNIKRAGYMQVALWKNNKERACYVHRLVAETFIPNPDNLPQINHIDGDKTNNNVNNLEWVTDRENKLHGWKNGLYSSNHTRKPIICLENGTIYNSVQEASDKIPCDRRYLSRHIKGKVKSVKGLHYEYLSKWRKEYTEGWDLL